MMSVFPVQARPGRDVRPDGRVCQASRTGRVHYHDGFRDARRGGLHNAVDIMANGGSTVFAPEAGRVLHSTKGRAPTPIGGHTVTMRAPDGVHYYMAHLKSAPLHGRGDAVEAGERMGRVGNTGNATRTCPHLHFQMYKLNSRREKQYINPYQFLQGVESGPTMARRRGVGRRLAA